MPHSLKKVLIVGSAPDAVRASTWDNAWFDYIVVINNAWKALTTWDILIHPEDFPQANRPPESMIKGRRVITAKDFVPIQNQYGGFVYAGGTMSFTAGYWVLGALRPDVIAYLGCDMIYDTRANRPSHFYGHGSADPLRDDVTLQSLEAKSVRLQVMARQQHCAVVNLSKLQTSRMLLPRLDIEDLHTMLHPPTLSPLNTETMRQALHSEAELGYWVPSGRYWEQIEKFDKAKLRHIDSLWLATLATAVSNAS